MMAGVVGLLLISLFSSAFATCPAGTIYESSYNKCYKYSASTLNFLSAEKACQTLGGSLVAVQNAYENSYISGVASASSSTPSFWIGSNLLMNTRWTWTSGYNGTYSNFAPGQPSDPSIYQCAAVRDVDNAWTKELCSTQKPYMCQIDPNADPVGNGCSTPSYPMTTASPSGCFGGYCSAGYTLNPDACKCYKFVNLDMTYNNATAWCGSENATLPYIRNVAENIFLSNYLKNQSTSDLWPWIGAYCNTSSPSSCRWADGSSLIYSNFEPGYPEGGETLYLNERNTMWYSWPDNGFNTARFVCEKTAWNSVVPTFQSRPNRRNTQRASNINSV